MNIAEISVKRPVFAIMMTAALIVLGAVSYESLGLDLALQMFRRDLGSKGIYAGIEGDHVSVSLAYDVIRKPVPLSERFATRSGRRVTHKVHVPPGIRRLPAVQAWPPVSRRKYRSVARFLS